MTHMTVVIATTMVMTLFAAAAAAAVPVPASAINCQVIINYWMLSLLCGRPYGVLSLQVLLALPFVRPSVFLIRSLF